MTNNPAFDGWVLELDVLYHIQRPDKFFELGDNSYSIAFNAVKWTTLWILFSTAQIGELDTRSTAGSFLESSITNGSMMPCNSMRVRPINTDPVYFLQVMTRAETHGLK